MSAASAIPAAAATEGLNPDQQQALDIYKELVEINTVTATGDTAKAAEAMAARLRAGGFADGDVHVLSPAPRKGNLVARLKGSGARKPILLVAHIDVVPASREDWSTDPFKLVEQDGYFYARGSWDDKYMAASFVTNLIRYKKEGYKPDRDIILALETDEEIFDSNALGIQWLLKHHRDLIDAEFALNEGGAVGLKDGKPIRNSIQTSEKVPVSYELTVKNRGGHSSVPVKDNAIYRLAEGLTRLSAFSFPVNLNETTRAFFERTAPMEGGQVADDLRAVLSGQTDPASAPLTRLSANAFYNAQLRTTCVATMLEGGSAINALPQVASAKVNCRIMPGEPVDGVKATLERVLADDQIAVRQIDQATLERTFRPARGRHRADHKAVGRILSRRGGAADDERRSDRRRLPPQCGHPDLRTFRHGRRRRRIPHPRPRRARSGQIVLPGRRVSLPAGQGSGGRTVSPQAS